MRLLQASDGTYRKGQFRRRNIYCVRGISPTVRSRTLGALRGDILQKGGDDAIVRWQLRACS